MGGRQILENNFYYQELCKSILRGPMEKDLPDHLEEIKLVKIKDWIEAKCDSCPKKSRVVSILYVGEVPLAKFCPCCTRRLKKALRK